MWPFIFSASLRRLSCSLCKISLQWTCYGKQSINLGFTYQWFKLHLHSKMVQNSHNVVTSITEIVFFSYNPVSLMIFTRSRFLLFNSFNFRVQHHSLPLDFLDTIKKEQEKYILYKHSCDLKFLVVLVILQGSTNSLQGWINFRWKLTPCSSSSTFFILI